MKSRAKLNYAGVQKDLDAGNASESLQLLREVGKLREQRELDRGGVNLPIPDQEVVTSNHGWGLEFRAPLPVEGWNAQISLLTGMAAAQLMMKGEIGILRTLPESHDDLRRKLGNTAKALGIAWPDGTSYAAVHPRAGSEGAGARGDAGGVHGAVPRRRVHGVLG